LSPPSKGDQREAARFFKPSLRAIGCHIVSFNSCPGFCTDAWLLKSIAQAILRMIQLPKEVVINNAHYLYAVIFYGLLPAMSFVKE
jgi:hypothetical protein